MGLTAVENSTLTALISLYDEHGDYGKRAAFQGVHDMRVSSLLDQRGSMTLWALQSLARRGAVTGVDSSHWRPTQYGRNIAR